MKHPFDTLSGCGTWARAYGIQRDTLTEFHRRCSSILEQGCTLRPLEDRLLTPERNLFSTLFLTTILALPLPEERARFYGMVNQCLRALVTGCDNILDDEYKEVIPFAFDGNGKRFRSVLLIMTAERVLAELAMEEMDAGRLTLAQAKALPRRALDVLLPSGLEEHEEESDSGDGVPDVDHVLHSVHVRKTALLFQAPLRLIVGMGEVAPETTARFEEPLQHLALACQVVDDIKDLADDLAQRRHNIVISLAYHSGSRQERDAIRPFVAHRTDSVEVGEEVVEELRGVQRQCLGIAKGLFRDSEEGFQASIPGWGPDQAGVLTRLVKLAVLCGNGAPPPNLPIEEFLE